ncbi:ROK family protein [Mycoplasma elephantis]|uniref:ROK family protein n=1 Tax=Mycoplasma elephantis TaxID=114882 RepID=UPI00055D4338|nr:ROK family protein [Mycoplasma elephantis]
MKCACIDIGGTNLRIAMFQDNQIKLKEKYLIISFCEKNKISKIAMCFPGIADYENGIILKSTNLPKWQNVSLKNYILNNSKIKKVLCARDSSAMAIANHFYFKQNKNDITQFFTISTGFGAGLIINNKIFYGANNKAQIVYNSPWSSVYNKQEMYKVCSGNGIKKRCQELNINLEPQDIFKKYDTNLEIKQIIDDAIEALSKAICSSIVLINPNLFVFGGSISRKNKWFINKAIEKTKLYLGEFMLKNVTFKIEELDDDSALIGLNFLINGY